jgi:pimeloyl-ACP methyl ester carboxylesterase
MEKVYKDTSINYVFYDNKSKTNLIYLHGWGQNIEMMLPIAKPFVNKCNVLIIDLPGFGLSSEPKEAWTLYDYADMVNDFVKDLKLNNPILIGHSFGGKISLCYALKYKVKKLILLASPYEKKISKPTFKMKVFNLLKKTPFASIAKKHMGSTDYRNASDMMRNVLVKHVNLDLKDEVKKIKCPTLLIWGTKDEAVDYEDALKLEKLIPDCGLVTYEGCTHYAYLERLNQTISVIDSFIGSDK